MSLHGTIYTAKYINTEIQFTSIFLLIMQQIFIAQLNTMVNPTITDSLPLASSIDNHVIASSS